MRTIYLKQIIIWFLCVISPILIAESGHEPDTPKKEEHQPVHGETNKSEISKDNGHSNPESNKNVPPPEIKADSMKSWDETEKQMKDSQDVMLDHSGNKPLEQTNNSEHKEVSHKESDGHVNNHETELVDKHLNNGTKDNSSEMNNSEKNNLHSTENEHGGSALHVNQNENPLNDRRLQYKGKPYSVYWRFGYFGLFIILLFVILLLS